MNQPTPRWHWISILFLALLAWQGSPLEAAAQQAKPNIILFLADDHGQEFAGCYGNKVVQTSHLDALARTGMRFNNVFAASPTCSPSRAALFTGLYPTRNGTMGNHTDSHPGLKSLPAYLRALGYRVVLANKGDVRPPSVFDFEILNATLPRNPKHNRRYRPEGLDTKAVDAFLAEHAGKHAGQPLCLILGDNCPHVVWEPNQIYDPAQLPLPPIIVDTPKTRTALANYYQDITTCDKHLGEVLSSVQRHGFAANTLFIYTADQGPEWPHCKWTCYDTGLKVPFVVRWPGITKPGTTSDAMISFVDMVPTFVDVAGGQPVANLDGRSFGSVLLGKTQTFRDTLFASHTGDREMNRCPQRCIRDTRYKYIFNLHPDRKWTTHFTLVMDIPNSHGDVYTTWLEKAKTDPAVAHLIQLLERHPAEELYDTQTDPYELNNLAARPEQAQRLADLRSQLRNWMKEQKDTDGLAADSPAQK